MLTVDDYLYPRVCNEHRHRERSVAIPDLKIHMQSLGLPRFARNDAVVKAY